MFPQSTLMGREGRDHGEVWNHFEQTWLVEACNVDGSLHNSIERQPMTAIWTKQQG